MCEEGCSVATNRSMDPTGIWKSLDIGSPPFATLNTRNRMGSSDARRKGVGCDATSRRGERRCPASSRLGLSPPMRGQARGGFGPRSRAVPRSRSCRTARRRLARPGGRETVRFPGLRPTRRRPQGGRRAAHARPSRARAGPDEGRRGRAPRRRSRRCASFSTGSTRTRLAGSACRNRTRSNASPLSCASRRGTSMRPSRRRCANSASSSPGQDQYTAAPSSSTAPSRSTAPVSSSATRRGPAASISPV